MSWLRQIPALVVLGFAVFATTATVTYEDPATQEQDCEDACSAGAYNACTCHQTDPCGWALDGVCDEVPCSDKRYEYFVDDDCSEEDREHTADAINYGWLRGD